MAYEFEPGDVLPLNAGGTSRPTNLYLWDVLLPLGTCLYNTSPVAPKWRQHMGNNMRR